MILVLIGRSGSGKTAIAKELVKTYCYRSVRTATTRDRRDGEPEDAYYFLSKEKFMKRLQNGEFVEYDCYNDNFYGTLKSELEQKGKHVVIMTPEGAERMKKTFPETFVTLIDVDMKTSVLRAIGREEELTPKKLQQISGRGCTDYYLYRNQPVDYVAKNPEGTSLEALACDIAKQHKAWEENRNHKVCYNSSGDK